MDFYNKQDGLKYVLQQRCNGDSPYNERKELPDPREEYIKRFHVVEEKMNREWHPQVNLGAALADGSLLTNHGVQHVQDVIRHAYDIISNMNRLTGYEIYILLLAIHFHDVGNITGRTDHEQKIYEVFDALGNELPLKTPEKQFISAIATAHGGSNNGDKDTIRNIRTYDQKYDNIVFRPKLLAAILRFADEISDDCNRSFSNIEVPVQNQVYHEYSKSLDPISITGDTLSMTFHIPFELTQKKLGKGNGKVFLYDEIMLRLAKLMRELEYCKKYAGEIIKLSSLSVTIEILQKNSINSIRGAGDAIRLSLQGYPDENLYSFEVYREKHDNITGEEKVLKYKDGKDMKKKVSVEVNND